MNSVPAQVTYFHSNSMVNLGKPQEIGAALPCTETPLQSFRGSRFLGWVLGFRVSVRGFSRVLFPPTARGTCRAPFGSCRLRSQLPHTLNPKSEARNPRPEALGPKPQRLYTPKPQEPKP